MDYLHCRRCSRVTVTVFILVQALLGLLFLQYGTDYRNAFYGDYEDVLDEDIQQQNIRSFSNDDIFHLEDDDQVHFERVSNNLSCFIEGTDLNATKIAVLVSNSSISKCSCRSGYYGRDCGVPDVIKHSKYGSSAMSKLIRRRKKPRRIINGMPVLKELELLEARFHELDGAVDLFMIGESNYSAHGDVKPLYILDQLQQGFLKEFHNKILHVFVGFFPDEGRKDSWVADRYLRVYMGKNGIPRISGVRDDDLFIITDADEIPSRRLIMFLKLYEGYTFPIAISLRWSLYGFFWKNIEPKNIITSLTSYTKEKMTTVCAVSTMAVVRDLMDNDPFLIRQRKYVTTRVLDVNKYQKLYPSLFDEWQVGSVRQYAGWHCSWCYGPEGIVLKLDSAQAGDLPRWGDYPEKHERAYLEGLIYNGGYFDGSSNTALADSKERMYAPQYLLDHSDRFSALLYHPSQRGPGGKNVTLNSGAKGWSNPSLVKSGITLIKKDEHLVQGSATTVKDGAIKMNTSVKEAKNYINLKNNSVLKVKKDYTALTTGVSDVKRSVSDEKTSGNDMKTSGSDVKKSDQRITNIVVQ